MQRHLAACCLLACAASLWPLGCGTGATDTEKKGDASLQQFAVTLDSDANPDHAGLLLANERGFFSAAGLDVSIHKPASPQLPVRYVADGTVDLAISTAPQVVLAGEKGVPIVAVGTLLTRTTSSMIWLPDGGVEGLGDLKGKTIAIAGAPFEQALLKVILARVGLVPDDVTVLKLGYGLVNALISGRANAILGAANVEGVELGSRGLEPEITPVSELGVPDYEQLVLIARREQLRKDPESIRAFIGALNRGTRLAIHDPLAAIDSVRANTELPLAPIPAELELTLPVLSRTARIDPRRWGSFVSWMHAEGLARRRNARPMFTNYLNPSDGS